MPTSVDAAHSPPPLPGQLDPRRGNAAPVKRPRRRILRRITIGLTCIASALVLIVSGTGYGLLLWSDAKIDRVDPFTGLSKRAAPSAAGATTFLVVGSDARTGMSVADQKRLHVGSVATAAGRRADTMLLVHISGRDPAVTVVSLPRDSYVTIPAHLSTDGEQVPERGNKLNAAYAAGGPTLAVATVERSTKLRIDHYIEVDFLGFEKLVDAVGGVDVCAPTPLRDAKAGLHLPAGISHVDGETGLAYVRARSLDARADLGRIDRQQRFLAAMVHRVTSRETLLDPRAMVRFLDAALSTVRADPGLQRGELIDLATRLRHLSGADVRFLTVPIANPSARPGGVGAVALWDEVAAEQLFRTMREDQTGAAPDPAAAAVPEVTVPPGQVRVRVYNGAGVPGLASTATKELASIGFDIAGPAQDWSTKGNKRTLLRYDSRYTESIKTLAAAIPGAQLEKVNGLGRTLQVVVGSSYDGATAVQLHSPAGTGPGGPTQPRTAEDDPCL